jgi:ATP-dependent RNA helicase RhlE
MSFESLGLEPELLRAVADKGYTTPTPIQLQAIPAVLSGRDVLAGAQTGTGKTAGFVLPLLQKLRQAEGKAPRVLVLSPTRELAAQIAESAADYGAHKNLRTRVIFGGVGERPQIDGLRAGCDLLIATPGRLIDLAERNLCDLSKVQYFVLDEADRMLDMGFIHAIKQIIRMLPQQRQNLMFSATYSDDIRRLAERYLKDPVAIEVTPRNKTADRVDQLAYRVPKEQKRHLLVHLFEHGATDEGAWQQALVFTRTKHGANRLAEQLEGGGVSAAAIHGNKSQSARVRALEDFKAGRIRALVATEVASRGLDIKELPQVVNYELPNVPEDYVHRIGRTARAGSTGRAVSLVAPDEASLLRDIEKTMRATVPFAALPQFSIVEPKPAAVRAPQFGGGAAQAPREQGGGRGQGQAHGHGGGRRGGGGHGGGRSQGGGGRGHGGGGGRGHGGGGGQGPGRGGRGVAPGATQPAGFSLGNALREAQGSGGVSRPSASPASPGGSAPRPGGHGGRPGSRSFHSEPSRRSRRSS